MGKESYYPENVKRAFADAGLQAASIADSDVDDESLALIKADIDAQFDVIRDILVAAGIVAEAAE